MKKIFAFIFAVSLMVSVASCTGNSANTATNDVDSTEVVTDSISATEVAETVDSLAVDTATVEMPTVAE